MNLGMTMALSGKKVLILELDLRKPKHERYFELGTVNTGVVNYLVDQNVRAEDIIVNSGLHPGLDVILSGPIPPNPGELILSRRLRGLIADLRKTYDTIILDTPPVGLVADALQLKDLPQATMYVVRAGYTRLPQLKVIEEIRTRQKLPKPFIVLNGVRFDGAGTYGYGYGYGYFGENEDKGGLQGWWQRRSDKNGSAKPVGKRAKA
jgi:capsular exopolysaccharide synthesis family protein